MRRAAVKNTKKHPLRTKLVYPPDFFDRLGHLLPGPNTEKLISLISENCVRRGIQVFRVVREIEKHITPILRDDLVKASNCLGVAPFTRLEELISKDSEIARRIMFGQVLKDRGAHRPRDYALCIFIIYLRKHVQRLWVRPHNAVICDFLDEQGMSDKYTPDRISKLARMDFQKLKEIYDFFLDVYEAPGISVESLDCLLHFVRETRRIPVDDPSSDRDLSLFPPWTDFMPQ
jgi:hypothetical protein